MVDAWDLKLIFPKKGKDYRTLTVCPDGKYAALFYNEAEGSGINTQGVFALLQGPAESPSVLWAPRIGANVRWDADFGWSGARQFHFPAQDNPYSGPRCLLVVDVETERYCVLGDSCYHLSNRSGDGFSMTLAGAVWRSWSHEAGYSLYRDQYSGE